jgi:hypothetical protein
MNDSNLEVGSFVLVIGPAVCMYVPTVPITRAMECMMHGMVLLRTIPLRSGSA